MADKITFMTQEDLLAQIHKDRASFAATWQNLTNKQMLQRPGPQDDWSVKDLIAHLIWWENFMIERVKDKLSGGEGKRTESIDSLNARIFEENQDRNLADILSEFALNLSKIEALVANLNNEQINDTNVINIKGEALLHYLIGDTFGHYDMHRDDLQNFVNNLE
jgi:hypothetical protein